MDKVCLAKDSSGSQTGSRVFGDCDALMQRVMGHILSPKELLKWETGRKERLKKYSKKRTKS